MTTTVKVSAHCAPDVEVKVTLLSGPCGDVRTVIILENGQTYEQCVYDNRMITICEVSKENKLWQQ